MASASVFASLAFVVCACVRTRTELIAPLDAPAMAVADSARAAVTEPAASRREAEGPSALAMQGVDFHVAPHIILHVRQLQGEAVATQPDQPVSFDDRRSFFIRVATADAGITLDDMGRLLNEYVFAYPAAPLLDLQLSSDGARLRLRGKLRKGGDVPFEILASLSTTAAGEIRIHPSSIRVARVPAGGLLKLVGLRLDRVLNLTGSRGARVAGNDIFLDVEHATPPPHIRGHLSSVRVDGDQIRLSFLDAGREALVEMPALPEPATNYLYFRGGTIRIGKLFMVHSDLEIIDEAAADPFDFDIDQYGRQLVAGYVKRTAASGLIVRMPDLKALRVPPSVTR
jgi:hypothetical protein